MIELTTQKIEGYAPNAVAAKNGRDLVSKKKFSNLKTDSNHTVVWGECAGSGKSAYICSVDFVDVENPVSRCNCPSRQFPCKHGLGLLYAYLLQPENFSPGDIPQDILDKRAKIEKKQEKKELEKASLKAKAEKPKKVNKLSALKKFDAQLSGVEIASKILNSIITNGLSLSADSKEYRNLQDQVKELGNYYISGIQTAFKDLLLTIHNVENEMYTPAIDQINYISVLLKKAAEYINQRKTDPDGLPDTGSAIEEQIGTVWKLTELIRLGLWEENAELVQLSFNCIDNPARKQFVDEGAWINLKTGKLYKTKNYRPYKAVKYVKENDSETDVLLLKDLYIYPGGINPRVRWENESKSARKVTRDDLARIQSYAVTDYAEMYKSVKNLIKNPLMDKNPLVLISLHNVYLNGEHIVAEDGKGNKLTLSDMPGSDLSPERNLKLILPADARGYSLLVMVNNNVETGLFSAQPLTIVSADKLTKLLF